MLKKSTENFTLNFKLSFKNLTFPFFLHFNSWKKCAQNKKSSTIQFHSSVSVFWEEERSPCNGSDTWVASLYLCTALTPYKPTATRTTRSVRLGSSASFTTFPSPHFGVYFPPHQLGNPRIPPTPYCRKNHSEYPQPEFLHPQLRQAALPCWPCSETQAFFPDQVPFSFLSSTETQLPKSEAFLNGQAYTRNRDIRMVALTRAFVCLQMRYTGFNNWCNKSN